GQIDLLDDLNKTKNTNARTVTTTGVNRAGGICRVRFSQVRASTAYQARANGLRVSRPNPSTATARPLGADLSLVTVIFAAVAIVPTPVVAWKLISKSGVQVHLYTEPSNRFAPPLAVVSGLASVLV